MKDKIRPIYMQLMGILSQTPTYDHANTTISTKEIWEEYNKIVDKLKVVTEKDDYQDFRIEPKSESWGDGMPTHQVVSGTFFRQQLNGLINYLHAEYFQNEKPPFSGEPQAVFNQNQTVSQNTEVQVLMMTVLEIQEKLIKKEGEYPPDTEENKFIKALKEALKNTKSNIDLINTILQTALATGLTLEKLKQIFS